MTKKDYIRIAEIIYEHREAAEAATSKYYAESYYQGQAELIEKLVEDLCVFFEEDNSNFDEEKFRNACGL